MMSLKYPTQAINLGSYTPYGATSQINFIISLSAIPLAVLIDDAMHGARIYELMSIVRPAEILHYLTIDFSGLAEELKDRLHQYQKRESEYENLPPNVCDFLTFSNCFFYQGDDTYPEDWVWLNYLDSSEYRNLVTTLFDEVRLAQTSLNSKDDFLIQNELKLIKHKQHPMDYAVKIDRLSKNVSIFSDSRDDEFTQFFNGIAELISREDIRSISCPFGGYTLWRILVEEQVKRSNKLGLSTKEALSLFGPDSGLGDMVKPEHWGGEVDIPYEGMMPADLVFLPDWRKFHQEFSGENGSLASATNLECRYLLVPPDRDLGDLGCATKTYIQDWVLYKSI